MFAKLAVVFAAVLAVAAQQCNVGSLQCCQSVQKADSPDVTKALGLINVVLSDVTAQVGLTCTPITVIGASGISCSAQPACCEGNNFNGAVVVGCNPINANV